MPVFQPKARSPRLPSADDSVEAGRGGGGEVGVDLGWRWGGTEVAESDVGLPGPAED